MNGSYNKIRLAGLIKPNRPKRVKAAVKHSQYRVKIGNDLIHSPKSVILY